LAPSGIVTCNYWKVLSWDGAVLHDEAERKAHDLQLTAAQEGGTKGMPQAEKVVFL